MYYGTKKAVKKTAPSYTIIKNQDLSSSCFLDVAWPFSSLAAFLNSLMPVPSPFMSSGIFLPPKSNNMMARMTRISVTPNLPIT